MLGFISNTISKIAKSVHDKAAPGASELVKLVWNNELTGDDVMKIASEGSGFFNDAEEYNIEVKAGKNIAYYPVIASNALQKETVSIMTKTIERRAIELIRLIVSNKDVINTQYSSKEDIIKQFRGELIGSDVQGNEYQRTLNESTTELSRFQLKKLLKESGANVDVIFGLMDKGGNITQKQCVSLTEANDGLSPINDIGHKTAILKNALTEAQNATKVKDQKELDAKINKMASMISKQVKKETKKSKNYSTKVDPRNVTKLNEMEPTVATVDFYYENNGSFQETTMVIAVKASVHVLDSRDLVEEVKGVIATERPFFRFIQFYTGEIKFFRDFVANIDQVSGFFAKDRSPAAATFSQLIQNSKQSKQVNAVNKVKGNEGQRLIPTTTLILTTDEVSEIYGGTQEDLFDTATAKRLIDTLNIMNFFIIDEAGDLVFKFNHVTNSFDRASIPSEDKENKKTDQITKALSMAILHKS